jgi:hypothetical protein
MTDYQTKSGRLKKKQPHVDFNLADNDDFFGFDSKEEGLTIWQSLAVIFIGLPVLYFVLATLLAMTPNI